MPANNFVDILGQRFGRLVVLRRSLAPYGKHAFWQCQCDCGNVSIVIGKRLRRGESKSCGCLSKEMPANNFVDMVGKRCGRLLVLESVGKTHNRKTIWRCQCDCGKEKFLTGTRLRASRRPTKSCGCLVSDRVSLSNQRRAKDLTGQRFGRLTAVRPAANLHSCSSWECRCDCGTVIIARTGNLMQGGTRSCGCLRIAAEFARGTNINSMDVPFEVTNVIKTRREIKRAIKQAS